VGGVIPKTTFLPVSIASSQFRLGLMYAKGVGMPQDSVKAHKWFSIAGSQGHQDANQLKSQLERQMTPSQIEKSQQLTKQWKPVKKLF
jgi:TPR repeat protein